MVRVGAIVAFTMGTARLVACGNDDSGSTGATGPALGRSCVVPEFDPDAGEDAGPPTFPECDPLRGAATGVGLSVADPNEDESSINVTCRPDKSGATICNFQCNRFKSSGGTEDIPGAPAFCKAQGGHCIAEDGKDIEYCWPD